MRSAAAVCLVALLAFAAAPAHAQLPASVAELLNNAAYRPFITKVMSLPSCLSDKNLVKFQISACPSLQRLLDAVQLGNANPPVTCEASCLDQFSLLSEKCSGDLRDAFEADKTSTGALATRFFAKCDELLAPILAPAPAPAPGPAMAAIALVEPAPEPAVTFDPLPPKPLDTVPLVSGSAAHKAVASLLALAAAAALLLA